jgi:hypothetical protein
MKKIIFILFLLSAAVNSQPVKKSDKVLFDNTYISFSCGKALSHKGFLFSMDILSPIVSHITLATGINVSFPGVFLDVIPYYNLRTSKNSYGSIGAGILFSRTDYGWAASLKYDLQLSKESLFGGELRCNIPTNKDDELSPVFMLHYSIKL